MATKDIQRTGYGQVEPNHLSAQRTAQIYAQLPAASTIDVLENGQYVKYDYAKGEVNFTGPGEWMMVFNEVKLYDDWRERYRDFAMKKEQFYDGKIVPRVIKTNIGDIYTTNCLGGPQTKNGKVEIDSTFKVTVKDDGTTLLSPSAQGYLEVNASPSANDMVWQVVKVYTMADGDPAVKLMRIQ